MRHDLSLYHRHTGRKVSETKLYCPDEGNKASVLVIYRDQKNYAYRILYEVLLMLKVLVERNQSVEALADHQLDQFTVLNPVPILLTNRKYIVFGKISFLIFEGGSHQAIVS